MLFCIIVLLLLATARAITCAPQQFPHILEGGSTGSIDIHVADTDPATQTVAYAGTQKISGSTKYVVSIHGVMMLELSLQNHVSGGPMTQIDKF